MKKKKEKWTTEHLTDAITTSQINACIVQALANGHSIRLQHRYQLNESTNTFSLFISFIVSFVSWLRSISAIPFYRFQTTGHSLIHYVAFSDIRYSNAYEWNGVVKNILEYCQPRITLHQTAGQPMYNTFSSFVFFFIHFVFHSFLCGVYKRQTEWENKNIVKLKIIPLSVIDYSFIQKNEQKILFTVDIWTSLSKLYSKSKVFFSWAE